ncbi:hypothetical protein ACFOMD_06580 [Sphingoaurantiacus capsulatus]|uniref:Uncharacterized protein n=1 Tax=Sphingoaurantiacus capsulatus TaxID=1771310 RepID=A0ABV7X879_9SPHN
MLLMIAIAATLQAAPIYDYRRSNQDGSEAERILVFLPDPTHVEVVKTRERCTSAAYVTATMAPDRTYAAELVAGRLERDAVQRKIGVLDYDAATSTIRVTIDGLPKPETLTITPGPWHLFDYDLASLTAALAGRTPPATLKFALPLVWNGEPPLLRDLGVVTANRVRSERFEGRAAVRYQVRGSGAFKGGPLWLDAASGVVLGADWRSPNHAEYRDFRLRLRDVHGGGAATWKRMLNSHFAGCPAKAD